MGCINSKKDINDVHPNIFHVISLNNDGVAHWSGQLEVSVNNLTLYRKGREPTKWELKHLRRYGFNSDQFSFEAGRKAPNGEGIYIFKCRRAETLFYTLQSYIQGRIYNDETTNPNDPYPIPVGPSTGPSVAARSVSQNNTATRVATPQNGSGTGSYVVNRGGTPAGIATSQSLSPNGTIHSNSNQSRSTDTLPMETSYLEPSNRSQTGLPQTVAARFQQNLRLSSVSSGPISPDVTSPSSPNSINNILEVTSLNPLPSSNATVGSHHGVSNLYQEFPVVKDGVVATGVMVGASVNRMSLDIPPQEVAPGAETAMSSSTNKADLIPLELTQMTPESEASRMYVNVNIPSVAKSRAKSASKSNSSLISINNNTGSFDENQYQNVKTPTSSGPNAFALLPLNVSSYSIDPSRCYENLEPSEIKSVLLRGRYSKPDIFSNVELPTLDNSEPCTPTATNRKVNYIVLDLDQSNQAASQNATNASLASLANVISPTGAAPEAAASLSANSSISNNNNNNPTAINLNNPLTPLGGDASGSVAQTPTTAGAATTVTTASLLPPESPKKASLGYATIDFNKTFALSNSTTPSSELDSEGSRKTRHNSTVTPLTRQSNSVSD
ncbi:fibroblast growth factor receptor substrate 2 [Uranotaenia lowii]|uniref:fibroblast growth factor receptor substrate 2 n=1 Tax=Uranotaenia lowii TaxID=190385 RepID=UPI00247B1D07|nr:fibroblast growth factor receptor substrate 2 [Uranotaenia lowii]XP_055593649.1 fibroblast growth factor receptor substrate 2 [Uranotaenia lowii]